MSLTTDQVIDNEVSEWESESLAECTSLAVELQKAVGDSDWSNIAKIGHSLAAYATTMAAIEQFIKELDEALQK